MKFYNLETTSYINHNFEGDIIFFLQLIHNNATKLKVLQHCIYSVLIYADHLTPEEFSK